MIWRLLLGITFCGIGTTIGLMSAPSEFTFGFVEPESSGVPGFSFVTLPLAMFAGIAAYGVSIQIDQIPQATDNVDFKSLFSPSVQN